MRLHFKSLEKHSFYHIDERSDSTTFLLKLLRSDIHEVVNDSFLFPPELFEALSWVEESSSFVISNAPGRPFLWFLESGSDQENNRLRKKTALDLATALDLSYSGRLVASLKGGEVGADFRSLPVKFKDFQSAAESVSLRTDSPMELLNLFRRNTAQAAHLIQTQPTHLLTAAPSFRNVLIQKNGKLRLIVGEDTYFGPPESELGFLLGEYNEHLFNQFCEIDRLDDVTAIWESVAGFFKDLSCHPNLTSLKIFAVIQILGHQLQQLQHLRASSDVEKTRRLADICERWLSDKIR